MEDTPKSTNMRGVGFEKTPNSSKPGVVVNEDVSILKSQSNLHQKRPLSPDRLGQIWWRNVQLNKQAPNKRFGFERLGHMHSVGIPFKFEELQGRHPFDFIQETKRHFRDPPRPREKSNQVCIEDLSMLKRKEWMEPLRKGQAYFDYCRDKWFSRESMIGSAVASICSLYSLWSITDLFLQNGGFAFLAVYFIITILFTIPLIYIELVIGQFHRSGPVKTMKQICPLMFGVGYFMLAMAFIDYLLSFTRLSWLIFYIATTFFKEDVPWRSCDSFWNSKLCKETFEYNQTNITYKEGERTPAVEEFRTNILRISKDAKRFQTIPSDYFSFYPNISVILCFSFMLPCFHYMTKLKCRELGRQMYSTFKFALFLIIFSFLIQWALLPKEHEILILKSTYEWLINLDWNFLGDFNVWVGSFQHAVVSSGVGTGIHITFGSHNAFTSHEMKYCAVINGLASFIVHSIVAFFFTLCHFAIKTTSSFKNNEKGTAYGSDTIFEIFPQVVAQHKYNVGIAWFLFIIMAGGIVLLSLNRILSLLHTIQQYFCDKDKLYYEPLRSDFNVWEKKRALRHKRLTNWMMSSKRRSIVMAKVILFLGLIQLATFVPYVTVSFTLLEMVWYKYLPPLFITLECFVLFFFLGVRTISTYVKKMTRCHVTLWYKLIWKSVTPVFPMLYFINFEPWIDSFHDYLFGQSHIFLPAFCIGIPIFLLLLQARCVLYQAPCRRSNDSLRLEATPEHDHEDIILGKKPLVRFHWMHHVSVSSETGWAKWKRHFKQAGSWHLTSHILSTCFENVLWDFLWNKLGFHSLNEISCCMKSQHLSTKKSFGMFPGTRLHLKHQTEGIYEPEYIVNKQITNVLKMKGKPVTAHRKRWIKEIVEVTPLTKRILTAIEIENIRNSTSPRNSSNVRNSHNSQLENKELKPEELVESSDEDFWEHMSTSEDESAFHSEGSETGYEESWDDAESIDWEYSFNPSSFLQTKFQHSRGKRESRKGVANYSVDELMEFEEIMKKCKKGGKRRRIYHHHKVSETDTDYLSDDIVPLMMKEIRLRRRRKRKKKRKKKLTAADLKENNEPNVAKGKQGDKVADKEKKSSDAKKSSSSSSSGDSSWSSRSGSGESLVEEPDVIVTATDKGGTGKWKSNKRGTNLRTRSKISIASKHSLAARAASKHSMAVSEKMSKKKGKKHARDAESVHGPFRKMEDGKLGKAMKETGKQLFSDVKQRLQNFLSVNITTRHHHKNASSKNRDSDSLS